MTGTSDNDDHRSLETGIGYKYFKEFGCANPASIDPVCDTAKKGANLCHPWYVVEAMPFR